MKLRFTRDVFDGGVRIHSQDDVAEVDAGTERWIRRGAAVTVEDDRPRRGRPPKEKERDD